MRDYACRSFFNEAKAAKMTDRLSCFNDNEQ